MKKYVEGEKTPDDLLMTASEAAGRRWRSKRRESMSDKRIRLVKTARKVVGKFVLKTRDFVKPVSKRKHFMWSLRSWGMDSTLLKFLIAQKCERIIIDEKDSGKKFVTTPEAYTFHGVERDYGFGKQTFLHESYFEAPDEGQFKLELDEREVKNENVIS